jgi:hypothetical protein
VIQIKDILLPATYKSDGNLVRNIGGSIIAKAVNRQSKGCFFYIHLDNNKEVRWEQAEKMPKI